MPIVPELISNKERAIWIGLVQVLLLPGSELMQDVSHAYTNVLTWASFYHEFQAKANELMDYLGLKLVGIEDGWVCFAESPRTLQ